MPRKKSGPNKTEFVLSLPAELKLAEVVAKAKEAGISISPSYVSNIRSLAKKGSGEAKKKAPAESAPAAEETAARAKPAGEKLSASDFIRSLPLTMPVKEVAAKGAAAGYSFKPIYVYDVRNGDRKRKGKAAKVSRAASPNGAAPAKPRAAAAPAHPSQKARLRKLMINLGLVQAEALYADVLGELKALRNGA